jgi:hypothetical protein
MATRTKTPVAVWTASGHHLIASRHHRVDERTLGDVVAEEWVDRTPSTPTATPTGLQSGASGPIPAEVSDLDSSDRRGDVVVL